jgi:putative sterol carrier protein
MTDSGPEIFTDAWCTACAARLNARSAYREAASGWEGDVVLEMASDPSAGIASERAVWLDLHDGVCRSARVATTTDRASAAYVLRADPVTWRRLLAEEVEPVAAVMAGKLRLARGNLFALAKYASAAREMVAAAGEVGGTFPAPAA